MLSIIPQFWLKRFILLIHIKFIRSLESNFVLPRNIITQRPLFNDVRRTFEDFFVAVCVVYYKINDVLRTLFLLYTITSFLRFKGEFQSCVLSIKLLEAVTASLIIYHWAESSSTELHRTSANTPQDALALTEPDLKLRSSLLTQVTSSFSEIPAMTFQKLFTSAKKQSKDKPAPRARTLSHYARGKVVPIVHHYKGKSSPETQQTSCTTFNLRSEQETFTHLHSLASFLSFYSQ